jgi:hypothetical protein
MTREQAFYRAFEMCCTSVDAQIRMMMFAAEVRHHQRAIEYLNNALWTVANP